jgi:hypothetical protein
MQRYFDHMEQKTPHERRAHATRVAGVITALVFVGWVSTLSLRAGGGQSAVANGGDTSSQTAAAVDTASYQGNQLIVASTTGN